VIDTKLMHGRAEGPGNVAILIGSSTGRDGIGGASVLASAEFDETSEEKRPSVQVGDPFSEKLLIEACLELIASGLIVGLQDLGAGGISCPTSEMTSKAGTGMRVNLDRVHRREQGMEPFEVMISESQERMLAVVEPAKADQVLAVCAKWGIDANVIGEVVASDRVEIVSDGDVVADVPAHALAEEGPLYERPLARPRWIDELQASPDGRDESVAPLDALTKLLGSPNIASKRWIWEQYDHMIFLGTLQGPGGDAAVIRLPGTDVRVAITTDGPGRYCYLDPYEGARLAVAEAARNVACVGAKPLAITNCLNFGNPEKEDVMWQFTEVIRGMRDACLALETPVTGGNVSFYNETKGRAIYPTPVIGMLGSFAPDSEVRGLAFAREGDAIVLVGATSPTDFGGSEYAKVVNEVVGGKPPVLDLEKERALIGFLAEANQLISSCHDISGGGLAVALAESAIASGLGFSVTLKDDLHAGLFSESPSRAVVSCSPSEVSSVVAAAERQGTTATQIGTVGGSEMNFSAFSMSLDRAKEIFEHSLPDTLSSSIG
jgi:phosphoribosylformylglycinamidine synthase